MNRQTKITIAAIIMILVLAPYAAPEERGLARDPSIPLYATSPEGKIAEELAILTSFALIDYNQSVEMFYQLGSYHEVNPILGTEPTRSELLAFGAVGVGIVYLLATTLPDPLRQIVVDSVIATEQLNIEENRRVYLGWNTDGPPLRGRLMDGIPILISLRF